MRTSAPCARPLLFVDIEEDRLRKIKAAASGADLRYLPPNDHRRTLPSWRGRLRRSCTSTVIYVMAEMPVREIARNSFGIASARCR